MLANVATQQKAKCALISLEMDKTEIASRLITSEARVNLQALASGMEDQRVASSRIANAASIVSAADIYIDDRPSSSIDEIVAKIENAVKNEGVGLVAIDYLQLIDSGKQRSENRVQEVSRISRMLKMAALKLRIPIIVLSQLSRKVEERSDKKPMLADLRESGSIEQDADTVVMLYRPEYYQSFEDRMNNVGNLRGVAWVSIAKQRNGPVGQVKLYFNSTYARFDNFDRKSDTALPSSGSQKALPSKSMELAV